MQSKKRFCAILAFWFAVWSGLALLIDNGILLASPLETAGRLFSLMGEPGFFTAVAGSLLRTAAGFVAGSAAGLGLAAASCRFRWLEELLAPPIRLMKAVPVASFAVLLLIWWGSSFLAVAVCFLIVLPILYASALEGLKSADRQLLEMAQVFRLSLRNRFFYIYRPALEPFLAGALKLSLGLCWKSGIAAEVIGTPDASIGGRLYLSKVHLDTAGVFAWTAAVIFLSALFERLALRLAAAFFAWEPPCRRRQDGAGAASCGGRRNGNDIKTKKRSSRQAGTDPETENIALMAISKSYDGQAVLEDFSAVYAPGHIYYLTSPSGSGKTTLLRILAGLTEPDAGEAVRPAACSMLFQEDRLCEGCSAVKNLELVLGDAGAAEAALCRLLPREALHKPCSQLSGGMRRRVALVRAMEASSACVLLDEPFTGMDSAVRRQAARYIRSRQAGRPIIIATHIGRL